MQLSVDRVKETRLERWFKGWISGQRTAQAGRWREKSKSHASLVMTAMIVDVTAKN